MRSRTSGPLATFQNDAKYSRFPIGTPIWESPQKAPEKRPFHARRRAMLLKVRTQFMGEDLVKGLLQGGWVATDRVN